MLTLWNGFDRVFDDELRRMSQLLVREPRPRFARQSYPRVRVLETDEALIVSAEVPGFAPQNVEVVVHDGVLTLEGKVAEAEEALQGEVLYSERRNVSFKRTFTLNAEVNVDAVTAAVKDGLLTVTLPKVLAVKPRHIAVSTPD